MGSAEMDSSKEDFGLVGGLEALFGNLVLLIAKSFAMPFNCLESGVWSSVDNELSLMDGCASTRIEFGFIMVVFSEPSFENALSDLIRGSDPFG